MVKRGRWSEFALVAVGVAGLYGCGCDKETVDRAVRFIETHQSCQTDADCVVIRDFCEALPGGYCGQLTMSRAGAESAEWSSL